MKFARYLQDTQIPEWKKAYIDYRGLKKQITAIRKARQPGAVTITKEGSSSDRDSVDEGTDDRHRTPHPLSARERSVEQDRQHGTAHGSAHGIAPGLSRADSGRGYGSTGHTPPLHARDPDTFLKTEPQSVELPSSALPFSAHTSVSGFVRDDIEKKTPRRASQGQSSASAMRIGFSRVKSETLLTDRKGRSSQAIAPSSEGHSEHTPAPEANATGVSTPGRFLANIKRRATGRQFSVSSLLSSSQALPLPLSVVLSSLGPLERAFFEKLDRELEKVDSFYRSREAEATVRQAALKEQLRELQDHRTAFLRAKAHPSTWASLPLPLPSVVTHRLSRVASSIADKHNKRRKRFDAHAFAASRSDSALAGSHAHSPASVSSPCLAPGGGRDGDAMSDPGAGRPPWSPTAPTVNAGEGMSGLPDTPRTAVVRVGVRRDPEEYKRAKKELKKAILEHYRGLELLNNYRVLNLTGFRKALKKFEKVVKVSVQQAYMREKVEVSAFSTGDVIEHMLREMEELFAARFERGDVKRARTRLRAVEKGKSHHFSTFRSGLYLGLAIPAFAHGLYQSFQPDTREALPWDALLLVYAALLIPTFFALLVGLNMWVWAHARINYAFIFELDVRKQLDHREYFEIPSLLLCALAYCFWFTFNRIGEGSIAATTWPLVWIVLAIALIVNPTPMLYPSTRFWFVRKLGRLLVAGTGPVEFTDFWLGDQMCSLIFTLSNLYFVGCAYGGVWEDAWNHCNVANNWGVPFGLAAIPLLIRTVQSVKRYVDSKLYTHLINGGKYASSIVFYAIYFMWRHNDEPRNVLFVIFILCGVNYSVYSCSWDLLMDWSFFKSPSQHRFLRKELVYANHYPVYYFAIISNIIIRFIWVIYIPDGGMNRTLRTFIAASLEMLRRWQWNIFRLENEHIGNTDQYRVTREVPLPYSFDDVEPESDEDADEDDEGYTHRSGWNRRRAVRMSALPSPDGAAADTCDEP